MVNIYEQYVIKLMNVIFSNFNQVPGNIPNIAFKGDPGMGKSMLI